jgi:hypothetical protein
VLIARKMLLKLIEHQEELFAAIIAPLNYRTLSALRATCKALFTTISGAYRWQHMHDFAPSLRQINSICRVILRCGNNSVICYRKIPGSNILSVYSNKININLFGNIKGIDINDLSWVIIYDIDQCDNVPQWLSNCIENYIEISYRPNCHENIIDLRP